MKVRRNFQVILSDLCINIMNKNIWMTSIPAKTDINTICFLQNIFFLLLKTVKKCLSLNESMHVLQKRTFSIYFCQTCTNFASFHPSNLKCVKSGFSATGGLFFNWKKNPAGLKKRSAGLKKKPSGLCFPTFFSSKFSYF